LHHGLLHNPEFWVLVSFVIFFALFGSRLWAAVAGLLDRRTESVRAELAEAQRLRHEAEAMLANAQREREQALAEAKDILARSHAEAARLAEAANAEAEAAAARRERMAMDRIAAAEKAAVVEVRQAAADVAIKAAAQVIGQGLGEQAQKDIVDGAIASLPRALRAA
jgi:F-type H+-transporting ATPase subunit b